MNKISTDRIIELSNIAVRFKEAVEQYSAKQSGLTEQILDSVNPNEKQKLTDFAFHFAEAAITVALGQDDRDHYIESIQASDFFIGLAARVMPSETLNGLAPEQITKY